MLLLISFKFLVLCGFDYTLSTVTSDMSMSPFTSVANNGGLFSDCSPRLFI